REIIGPLGIGKVLRELDPTQMSGSLIAIPLANMSAFEFAERNSLWDDTNMEDVGEGRPDGSLTERLAYRMFHDCIFQGDAYIEIHSASAPTFVWYTIYLGRLEGAAPEVTSRSRQMALAWGLEQVWASSPWSDETKIVAMHHGIPAIMPEIGGGASFFVNGEEQIATCARGIVNVMKLMGILPGQIETESPKATVWDVPFEFFNDGQGGLMLAKAKRGQRLKKGDLFAVKYDPTTGEEIEQVLCPGEGTLLNTGLIWPHVRGKQFLGVLGHRLEEVDLTTHTWEF
ncbi:MAG: hypothetical protein GX605_02675, partial [Chloroflexi bacterium]|nr:hypothetical protein [Chloroflexota bacterium]